MEMTVTEIGAVVVAELRAAGYLESPECATRRWCFGWRCETAIALPS